MSRAVSTVVTVTIASLFAAVVALAIATSALTTGGARLPFGSLDARAGYASPQVSAFARAQIPPRYLALYLAAAKRYRIDWAILAAIGEVECDHGRDPDPSCTQEGAVNSAGAGGPMQFLASTWRAYGLDADGDGRADRWDPADAISSAAAYLVASGAPQSYQKAIFAYNHSAAYVEAVESWARRYEAPHTEPSADRRTLVQGETATPILYVRGEQAKLLRGDPHLALIPTNVPPQVQALLIAGNELQDLPYGPSGHPDPLHATSEDCSSTVNYVLYRAGIRPLAEIIEDNPLAQDYVHWGARGPGRWVTLYATDLPTPHVFIVIAGLRLDTSHNGTDEGPNRYEDGPRWRLLPYIPTWAKWSVRHPPGL